MSSRSSYVEVSASSQMQNNAAGYSLGHSGSVYFATPVLVSDGQSQGFAIDAYGRQIIVGPSADNNAFLGNPLGVGGIYNATLPTYDDGDAATLQVDSRGRLIVVDEPVVTALGSLATENTLDSLLTAFNGEDFATQATLASVLADTNSLVAKDYATQTTLAAVLADTSSLAAEDFATQTTLNSLLTAFNAEDFASEATLNLVLDDTTLILTDLNTLAGAVAGTEMQVDVVAPLPAGTNEIGNVGVNGNAVRSAVYNSYASSSLPGNASSPLELVASLSGAVKKISVIDTGGVPFEIMIGAAAAETRKLVLGPGVEGEYEVDMASGARVSVRRLDDAAAFAVGDICINFLG